MHSFESIRYMVNETFTILLPPFLMIIKQYSMCGNVFNVVAVVIKQKRSFTKLKIHINYLKLSKCLNEGKTSWTDFSLLSFFRVDG